ncbi:MAG: hypothetical protein IAE95_08480 [Chitinophagaceae bacterium]|nr:hypothetical protein [Chitinophagaceae bacterium]
MQSQHEEKYREIIERLDRGMKFGLFENGNKCYFQDGLQIAYTDLWQAIKLRFNSADVSKMPLSQICPDAYVGAHTYKFSRHNWRG